MRQSEGELLIGSFKSIVSNSSSSINRVYRYIYIYHFIKQLKYKTYHILDMGKYINPEYVNMSEEQKRKQIRLNYYNKTGKLNNAIATRCKRFNFDKNIFNDCKTIDDLNDMVKHQLSLQGYSDLDISRLFVVRKSTYEPRKR